EFSFKPRESCFPFVGCVSYRGYYRREDAEAFAAELRGKGDEVYVYGVAAYSTLGWFDDPVLNTFIQSSSAELARLIFHELAHQVVYIKGNSMFNESFAVAVEEEGVRRWLARHASDRERSVYAIVRERRAEFVDLVLRYREVLDRVYRQTQTVEARRAGKRRLFAALDADYRALKTNKWNGWAGYDRWFDSGVDNARIASVATYKVYVPSFRALLARRQGDMNAFYTDMRRLAALDPQARDMVLAAMATEPP
ncbi:MAG TPA: aminopeptidase, partial [Rhodocyclaceae bacterium]|nr:aminopeptidase [Rhodocyclaceae bacterium]